MNRIVKTAHKLALNPWLVLAGTVSSIAAFLWMTYDFLVKTKPQYLSIISFSFSLAIFCIIHFYSVYVRRENSALRRIAYHIHRINHEYRNVLCEKFSGDNPAMKQEELISVEKDTLQSVCSRIEKIFTLLIGRDCMVTVKLIYEDETSGRKYCKTYVRSEPNCVRDESHPFEYEIGTGANTAFDTALKIPQAGKPSHFYSADLTKEKDYNNQRQHWENFYRSTIVVPIRALDLSQIGTQNSSDDIGFLCVDTLSKNRLNNGYHLQLMAAFADQMYNFISLMRGKYSVLVN